MSSPKITVEEVQRVARLARLSPTPAQAEALAHDLGKILAYVDELSAVDTSGVEATSHAIVTEAPLREDSVQPSVSREEVLDMAPASHDGGFAVPKVLEVE